MPSVNRLDEFRKRLEELREEERIAKMQAEFSANQGDAQTKRKAKNEQREADYKKQRSSESMTGYSNMELAILRSADKAEVWSDILRKGPRYEITIALELALWTLYEKGLSQIENVRTRPSLQYTVIVEEDGKLDILATTNGKELEGKDADDFRILLHLELDKAGFKAKNLKTDSLKNYIYERAGTTGPELLNQEIFQEEIAENVEKMLSSSFEATTFPPNTAPTP